MMVSRQAHAGTEAADIASIEALAVELATLAGREITAALSAIFTVPYKTGPQDAASLRNPVSPIDPNVENLVRERLTARFPDHGIIGEELS